VSLFQHLEQRVLAPTARDARLTGVADLVECGRAALDGTTNLAFGHVAAHTDHCHGV
jgi:hypothetical protein